MTSSGPAPEPTRVAMAVVVVNYGSSELLARNLCGVSRSCPDLLVVVVDNFSSAEELDAVERLAAAEGWSLVASPTNDGFGAGANRGVEAAITAGAQELVLLNPDASIGSESIDALHRHLTEAPCSVVSPTVLRPDGTVWFRGGTLELRRGRTRSRPARVDAPDELPWLSGACIATTAAAWRTIGGFDEDYFLYWEDVDLSVRATEAGVDLRVLDDVTATHDEGGTQERRTADFSSTYYVFNIRNRLLFGFKHLDGRSLRRWLVHSPRQSYLILLRGGGRRKFLRPWIPLAWLARGLGAGWRDGWRARRASAARRPGVG